MRKSIAQRNSAEPIVKFWSTCVGEYKICFMWNFLCEGDYFQFFANINCYGIASTLDSCSCSMRRDVHFAVNSKILLSAVTQFEFAVNSAVNRNYQRYDKR